MGVISLKPCHAQEHCFQSKLLFLCFCYHDYDLWPYHDYDLWPLAAKRVSVISLTICTKNGVKIDLSSIGEFASYKFVAVGKWKCPQQPEEGAGQGCIIHNLRSEGRIGKQEGKKRLLLICIFEPL